MTLKNLTVIKIGGSVATFKEKARPILRKKVLEQLAKELSDYFVSHDESFVLVHGAGSFGHPLAKKYDLANLKNKKKNKLGISLTRNAVQGLNSLLAGIFTQKKCPVFSLPPASLIIQKNGWISAFDLKPIKYLLEKGFVPVLYGDGVLDKECEFSICSGDQIISYLSEKLSPQRIFFLTDVDGLFSSDPRENPQAKLIKTIKKSEIISFTKKTKSKKTDVTGLMAGKLSEILKIKCPVYIFSGLKKGNLLKSLEGENVGTEIK